MFGYEHRRYQYQLQQQKTACSQYPNNPTTDQIIAAWKEYAVNLIDNEGRVPYLVTMMFKHIPGPQRTRMNIMMRDIERIYGRAATRCVRNPRAPSQVARLPIWLVFPDYPVWKKRRKQSIHDVTVNDGLHYHIMIFIHPQSRLKETFQMHLVDWQGLYARPEHPLDRIEAEEIDHDPDYVLGYLAKSVRRFRFGASDILILPCSVTELNAP